MQTHLCHLLRSQAPVVLPAISALWLAIGVGIIGVLTPDYSHISQFMSALGATGAPYAAWVNYAVFIPAEIWFLAFLFSLRSHLYNTQTTRFSLMCLCAYAVLLIAAALFPCDAGCQSAISDETGANTLSHIIHMLVAAAAYPIALIGLLSLCLSVRGKFALRLFAVPTATVGFGLFFAIPVFHDAQGLLQRVLEAWIYLQFVLVEWHVAANRPHSIQRTA